MTMQASERAESGKRRRENDEGERQDRRIERRVSSARPET